MAKPTITIDEATGIAIITVHERRLDTFTAPDFRAVSVQAVSALHYRQILDLAAVQFADSTGLGVILGAEKRAMYHGGCLVLANVGVDLAHTLRITGLAKRLIVASDIESAIAFLNPDVQHDDPHEED